MSSPTTLTEHQQRQLDQLIAENGTTDQTALIRKLKHSGALRIQISALQDILTRHQLDADNGPINMDAVHMEAMAECELLCKGYPDIYKFIVAGKADMTDIQHMLHTLEEIEEGRLTQHVGAFKVGESLTDRYAKRVSEQQQQQTPPQDEDTTAEGYRGADESTKSLSWAEWKASSMKTSVNTNVRAKHALAREKAKAKKRLAREELAKKED